VIDRFLVNSRHILALVGALIMGNAQAVTIIGYTGAANDRFSSGYATAPVPNTSGSFIGAGLDFSGVGWNPALTTQSFTMISDEYFVFASHYPPSSSISFFSPTLYAAHPGDPASAVVTYSVSGVTHRLNSPITGLPSDFSVGKLSTAISAAHGIGAYSILGYPTLGDYVGLPLLVYGHGGFGTSNSPRIGTNMLDGFIHYDLNGDTFDETYAYGFSASASPTGEARLEGGDSGSPSFTVINGELVLLGTHSAVGTLSGVDYSFDNFIPIYLSQFAPLSIEFSVVPEPSRAVLLMAGLLFVFTGRQTSARSRRARSPHR
jgi:hypothetical protein